MTGGDSRRDTVSRASDGQIIILIVAHVDSTIRHVADQGGFRGQTLEVGEFLGAISAGTGQGRVIADPAVPAQPGINSRFARLPTGFGRRNTGPVRTTENTRLTESLQVLFHIVPRCLRTPCIGSELKFPVGRITAVLGRGGKPAVVFAGVHQQRGAELLMVAEAFDGMRLAPRLIQRRKQHGGENGDDRYDHEQLNKGKLPIHEALGIPVAIFAP